MPLVEIEAQFMFAAFAVRVPTLLMFALKLALAAVVNEVKELTAPSNCESEVWTVSAGRGVPLPVNVFLKFISWPAFAVRLVSDCTVTVPSKV